jgi:hypothetical protein
MSEKPGSFHSTDAFSLQQLEKALCNSVVVPCKGLRDQLRDHLGKLKNYLNNPYDPTNDNNALLRDNPASRHNSIISGRLTKLLNQVENFKKLLEACEQQNGMR